MPIAIIEVFFHSSISLCNEYIHFPIANYYCSVLCCATVSRLSHSLTHDSRLWVAAAAAAAGHTIYDFWMCAANASAHQTDSPLYNRSRISFLLVCRWTLPLRFDVHNFHIEKTHISFDQHSIADSFESIFHTVNCFNYSGARVHILASFVPLIKQLRIESQEKSMSCVCITRNA